MKFVRLVTRSNSYLLRVWSRTGKIRKILAVEVYELNKTLVLRLCSCFCLLEVAKRITSLLYHPKTKTLYNTLYLAGKVAHKRDDKISSLLLLTKTAL